MTASEPESESESEPMTEPECACLNELEGAPHAVVFDHDAPRTIRLTLESDQQLPGHCHPGTNVVCHLVEGELDFTLDGKSHPLAAGDLLRFSGDREISPTAIEDSVAVLVFAPQKS